MDESNTTSVPKNSKDHDTEENNDLEALNIPLRNLHITKQLSKEDPMELETTDHIVIQYPDDISLDRNDTQRKTTESIHDLNKIHSNYTENHNDIKTKTDVRTVNTGYQELPNSNLTTSTHNKIQNNNAIVNGNFERREPEPYSTVHTDNKHIDPEDLCFQYPDDINDTSLHNDKNILKDLSMDNNSTTDSDSGSDNWETVPAVASYNVYNNKGELELKKYTENDMEYKNKNSSENNNAGPQNNLEHKNTFEYTKVTAEQQAQRSYNTNKKTEFLFQHKKILKSLQNNNYSNNNSNFNLSQQSLNNSASTLSLPHDSEQFYDEYEDDVEKTDDLNLNSQLNITNLLLTDMEKIAYAGAVNILTNKMCEDLATLCLCVDITSNKK